MLLVVRVERQVGCGLFPLSLGQVSVVGCCLPMAGCGAAVYARFGCAALDGLVLHLCKLFVIACRLFEERLRVLRVGRAREPVRLYVLRVPHLLRRRLLLLAMVARAKWSWRLLLCSPLRHTRRASSKTSGLTAW